MVDQRLGISPFLFHPLSKNMYLDEGWVEEVTQQYCTCMRLISFPDKTHTDTLEHFLSPMKC